MAIHSSSPVRRVDAVRRGVGPLEPVPGREVRAAGRVLVDGHVEQHRTDEVDARLDGGHVDLGPLPGDVAAVDGEEQRRRVVVGGLVVHVRQAPARRLPPGQPADVGETADGLHHRSVAAVLGVRAGVPEAAHPCVDHLGRQLVEPLIGQPPPLHHAGREVLGHDAALADESLGQLAALRGAHVDGDAELVAAVVVEQAALVRVEVDLLLAEVAGRLVLVQRQLARRVDADPVLDLDDLRAEVGQQAGSDRADPHPAEVGDSDPGQRTAPLVYGRDQGLVDRSRCPRTPSPPSPRAADRPDDQGIAPSGPHSKGNTHRTELSRIPYDDHGHTGG